MILTNGVVRTMDASLPRAAALAIAGERIVGGVGTHEWALPTPERIDLGGRCVLPAFTDSHVHFPSWSLARRDVSLEGTASLEEALARIGSHRATGEWVRGRGWRDAQWAEKPTRQALDAVVGDTPAALWSKDYHSLWLSSAALARAGGDLDVPGGVVERDDAGEPTGVLREESAWRFRERHVTVSEDEWVSATREGLKVASSRGVGAIHDKDGWLGAPAIFGRIHETAGLTLRVWQSLPAEQAEHLAELGLRSRIGDDFLRLGYLKAFMDGTLGSQTAWMLDGSGVRITSGDELAELIRAGASGRLADRRARDRRPREPRGARRVRGDERRLAAARAAAADRARPVPRPGGPRPLRRPRRRVLGAVQPRPSDRDLAERFWGDRLEGTYASRSLADSGAVVVNGSDAPVEELDPLAGICAGVLRTIDERPAWRPDESLTIEQALHASTVAPAWLAGDERRRGKLLPGFLADLVVLDRDPVAISARRAPRGAGRRDDGRRPLGAPATALGLRRGETGVQSRDAPGRRRARSRPRRGRGRVRRLGREHRATTRDVLR